MLGPVAQGEIQQVGMRLSAQAEALAALAAALRLRQSKSEAAPEVQAALDEVVAALGLTDALESASPAELAAALAPIRALFLQANDLLTDPARAPGWSYTDADVLESLGRTSAGFAGVLRDTVAPQLDGLEERLAAEGASFLDVGVGVAGLAIAMAGQWPNLRVVGIDPWEPSLALARANVSAAGLDDRIELRGARAEELDDRHAFDLAFLPAPFSLGRCSTAPWGACGRPSAPAAGSWSACIAVATASTRRSLSYVRPARGARRRRRPKWWGSCGGPVSSRRRVPRRARDLLRARRRSPSVVFAA